MDVNGSTPIDGMLQAAAAQQQAQQMQAAILNEAGQNPHTIERIQVAAVGVGEEPPASPLMAPTKILMVATLDGRRRDIKLSPDSIRLLRRALADGGDAE